MSNAENLENVRLIQEAPSYLIRQKAEKARQTAEIQDVMAQYYTEHPDREREQRKARIAALGLRAIDGAKPNKK
jgi:hypothetical protein